MSELLRRQEKRIVSGRFGMRCRIRHGRSCLSIAGRIFYKHRPGAHSGSILDAASLSDSLQIPAASFSVLAFQQAPTAGSQ